MRDKMTEKLLSGRFWLTIISGVVFAYTAIVRILPEEAVAAIISMVFMAYFDKKKRGQSNVEEH